MRASAEQGGSSYQARLQAALSLFRQEGRAMLTSKICTEHAIKCIQTAEAFPPGAQREKFFDMAKRWTDLAINIEGSEALANPSSPPAK